MADTTLTDPTAGAFAPPLTTDESQIHDEMVASLQTTVPGWDEVNGSLDNQLLWASAEVEAETRGELQANLQSYVMSLIGALFHIPRQAAVSAASSVTVTAIDTAGYTLRAGTSIYLGELELQTLDDLVIAPLASSASVAVWTAVAGADANGSTGDLTMDAVQDALGRSWVDSVTLDAPLSGGVDAEDDTTYSYRLANEMRTVATAQVLPQDFAILATKTDGIEIAWAIEGYDPTDGTTGNKATITVVAAAADGSAPSGPTLAAAQAALSARTLLCSQVFVIAPTYVTINVATTVNANAGWLSADVQAQAEATITAALNPAVYAAPALNVAPTPPPAKLYANDLIADVKTNDQGVEHVISLTVNSGASVTFTVGELPQPGTVTVTVS